MPGEAEEMDTDAGDPAARGRSLVEATERLYRTFFTGAILAAVAAVVWGLVNQPFDNPGAVGQAHSVAAGLVLLVGWLGAAVSRARLFRLLRRRPGWALAIVTAGALAVWIDGAPGSLYYFASLAPLLVVAVPTDLRWTLASAGLLIAAYAVGVLVIHGQALGALGSKGVLDDFVEQLLGYLTMALLASLPLESLGGFVLRISQVYGGERKAGAGTSSLDGRRAFTASLSVREVEVAQLVAEGYSNDRIARELYLSPRTIQSHVANAMRKTETSSRTELAVLALREGLLLSAAALPRASRSG